MCPLLRLINFLVIIQRNGKTSGVSLILTVLKESKKYIQKPIYGIFVDGWCGIASANINEIRFFTTINKNGRPSRSKKVHLYAREYADTEEECIKLYNSLVQKKIDYFQQRIEEVKKEFVKEDFV